MTNPDRTAPYHPGTSDTPADRPRGGTPERVGRYRVERVLGEGGFGSVFLAHDDTLHRRVAVKVPHRHLVARREDAEPYLHEARVVAGLDHPHIVPVFDFGSTDDDPCFIVSKYVEGVTLARRIREARPAAGEAAELTACVAEALDYAHKQGLVHRDVKPGNILLDLAGRPYLADFGLAQKEDALGGWGVEPAGTPAYMSPEQARGEGHRVDARSDIFSLGVVFYELLTGKQPFRGKSQDQILDKVRSADPPPPRQVREEIPRELERICLKALAKRAAERYPTAKDLADDLWHFLAEQTVNLRADPTGKPNGAPTAGPTTPVPASLVSPASTPPDGHSAAPTLRVVPKGLRSFDAHDADFFLELLPGPRDRDGLPDSLRFWKTRIEERDPDQAFSVGLLYGPSGCGKSSLVKAGLLPRLADCVRTVYVEATADETEARLLAGLRKQCPDLPVELGLKEALAALRRGQWAPGGRKVLLVLDQFEQWLHATRADSEAELVQALRQCDGGQLQALVLVRDDFWMAATRFMRDLEIDLIPGRNVAAVDLFDPRHAKRVLTAFGRAFGTLPDPPAEPEREQRAFVEQAVAGLAEEAKVVCVRLALFAEMMKGKPWTTASLKAVGGTAGVGVTFLEETFSSPAANPTHRLHQEAARAVLRTLLPEPGADIKGHMRSADELKAASGYADRPRDFDALLRILDSELRLITPTDKEGKEDAGGKNGATPSARYYQLTHDYLVPALNDWLTRKQKETRRGRAELLLADRAAVWGARPENRQLPTFAQWAGVWALTDRRAWTAAERRMMARATRYHLMHALVLVVAVLGATLATAHIRGQLNEQNRAREAAGKVQSLLVADTVRLPTLIKELEPYRPWADPLLRTANDTADAGSPQKLRTSLALLPVDPGQAPYLAGRLLDATAQEAAVLCAALAPHGPAVRDQLWAAVKDPPDGREHQRLRAACGLAVLDPTNPDWEQVQEAVALDLVDVPAVYLSAWMELLRPAREQLLTPLGAIYRDPRRPDTERWLATDVLGDYASDRPELMADLLMDADEKQFVLLYPKFHELGRRGQDLLAAELDRPLTLDAPEHAVTRQVNAAVGLLRLGAADRVWPRLRQQSDPRLRSYLVHRLGPQGADGRAVARRFLEETDPGARRALLLCLGEFSTRQFGPNERAPWIPRLRKLYEDEPDPGLHAAAEWLLRTWGDGAWLAQTQKRWAGDARWSEQRLAAGRARTSAGPQWYVNGQGQTFVVVPGPGDFLMGSPEGEPGREPEELRHRHQVARSYALGATQVTVEQFLRFRKDYPYLKQYSPDPDCPITRVDWYEAAAYCNWLSAKEGLPESEWCYEPNEWDEYADGMSLAPNYLSRTGYRLPTEAEWEYACRAGTTGTRYFFGNARELLGKYAWHVFTSDHRSWPVGSLKPNDWGFFDIQGNVFCWCGERLRPYEVAPNGAANPDVEDDKLEVNGKDRRALRGGSFADTTSDLRAAYRIFSFPHLQNNYVGFRVARTFR